jgi:hypothetical protein
MAGHFGMDKTVAILQKHFYWQKILQDVSKYIGSSISYSIANPSIKNQGLSAPLSTP